MFRHKYIIRCDKKYTIKIENSRELQITLKKSYKNYTKFNKHYKIHIFLTYMKEYTSRPLKKNYDLGQYAALYRSAILGMIKEMRQGERDYSPTTLDFGKVKFRIARHFGFCKGVENAIEMAYQALEYNIDKPVYMVSELIHNPYINEDLTRRGLQFIKTSTGKQLISWENLHADDVVVIPAFGATVQDKAILQSKGIDIKRWDAMCRFVEHVWFRAEELGKKGFTIIVHGKFQHEETQATFSYSNRFAPTIVVKDMKMSHILGEIIAGTRPLSDFETHFRATASAGFDPILHCKNSRCESNNHACLRNRRHCPIF